METQNITLSGPHKLAMLIWQMKMFFYSVYTLGYIYTLLLKWKPHNGLTNAINELTLVVCLSESEGRLCLENKLISVQVRGRLVWFVLFNVAVCHFLSKCECLFWGICHSICRVCVCVCAMWKTLCQGMESQKHTTVAFCTQQITFSFTILIFCMIKFNIIPELTDRMGLSYIHSLC